MIVLTGSLFGVLGCSPDLPEPQSPANGLNAMMKDNDSEVRPAAHIDKKVDELLKARLILERSLRAYSELKSYTGQIISEGETRFQTNTLSIRLKCDIAYVAPNMFRFQVKIDDRVWILGTDGKHTWQAVEPPIVLSKRRRLVDPRSITEGLYAFAGITNETSTMLPPILLGLDWDMGEGTPQEKVLAAFAAVSTYGGDDVVDDHKCARVIWDAPMATWTLWIDKESYLLRRMKKTTSELQQSYRKRGSTGSDAVDRILSREKTDRFVIESIDAVVDHSQFIIKGKQDE